MPHAALPSLRSALSDSRSCHVVGCAMHHPGHEGAPIGSGHWVVLRRSRLGIHQGTGLAGRVNLGVNNSHNLFGQRKPVR